MKREEKNEKIFGELYRRAYAQSEPSADWDELLANAPLNERGERVINYLDYEIDDDLLKSIFEDVMKEFKVRKYLRQGYYISFMLGCSPKSRFKKVENE